MNTLLRNVLAIATPLISLITLQPLAVAVPNRPVTVAGAKQLLPVSAESAVESSVVSYSRTINPIRLRFAINDRVFVHVRLTRERRFKGLDKSKIRRVLQGSATFGGDRIGVRGTRGPAAASFVISSSDNGTYQAEGLFETVGTRRLSKRTSLLSIKGQLGDGPSSRMLLRDEGKTPKVDCGTVVSHRAHDEMSRSTASAGDMVGTNGFQQLEILLEGDNEFFAGAGASALSELAQILSLTDVIYRRDLNITIQPTIVESPVPYSSVFRYDENFQLDFFTEMRSKRPTFNEDVYAVITGKTPPDASLSNVAGIADEIGSTCRNQSQSQTVVRRFDGFASSTFYTFAHEVGHLMGGEHDDTLSGNPNTGYIMNSGTRDLNEFLERFSQYSINQIGGYFSQNGSCLVDVGDAPPAIAPPSETPGSTPPNEDPGTAPPDLSSVTLEAEVERIQKKDVPYFYAYNGDEPIAKAVIQVYRSGKTPRLVKQLKTRSDGSAAYKKAAKGKYYGVLASDTSVISNLVTVRK